jgi:hypothetical protein
MNACNSFKCLWTYAVAYSLLTGNLSDFQDWHVKTELNKTGHRRE